MTTTTTEPIDGRTEYAYEVEAILMGFDSELCDNCAEDIECHVIAPDPLGHPHVYCLTDMD